MMNLSAKHVPVSPRRRSTDGVVGQHLSIRVRDEHDVGLHYVEVGQHHVERCEQNVNAAVLFHVSAEPEVQPSESLLVPAVRAWDHVRTPVDELPTLAFGDLALTKMLRTLAGEGGLRPHQLRHFSVTQLLAAGVPEVEVMGRHGHASASSMKPYRHYIRAKDRMSTEAMRDVLDGPTPRAQ